MKETTVREMKRDLAHIEKHTGEISPKRMLTMYDKYLNGADSYILGAELNGEAVALKRKHIPEKWCSCQTDHKEDNQYLRLRPHKIGAIEMSESRGAFIVGDTEEIYQLYKCNTKKGYNSGYCFEIALFNLYGIEGWKQDNKASSKGGDIVINGEEIQIKYVEKDSLATITSTKKIKNEILRRLEKVA